MRDHISRSQGVSARQAALMRAAACRLHPWGDEYRQYDDFGRKRSGFRAPVPSWTFTIRKRCSARSISSPHAYATSRRSVSGPARLAETLVTLFDPVADTAVNLANDALANTGVSSRTLARRHAAQDRPVHGRRRDLDLVQSLADAHAERESRFHSHLPPAGGIRERRCRRYELASLFEEPQASHPGSGIGAEGSNANAAGEQRAAAMRAVIRLHSAQPPVEQAIDAATQDADFSLLKRSSR